MIGRMIRIFTDPRCLEHVAPRGYPERPDRLSGIVEHLRARFDLMPSPPAPLPRERGEKTEIPPGVREAVLALHEEL
jgi:hypothetical protein